MHAKGKSRTWVIAGSFVDGVRMVPRLVAGGEDMEGELGKTADVCTITYCSKNEQRELDQRSVFAEKERMVFR